MSWPSRDIVIQHEDCDCEQLQRFSAGGYYPIVIGDLLDARYEVVYKLGYGGSATVWMARDRETDRNVALKIFTAKASNESGQRELVAYKHLQTTLTSEDRDLIVPLHRSFTSGSANGQHLCLVLGLSGPSLSSILRRSKSMKLRPDIAQKLAFHITRAIALVHKAGIIYHDLSPGNILLDVDDAMTTMTPSELYDCFGPPKSYPLAQTEEYKGLDLHLPTHVYDTLDFTKLENIKHVQPAVKLVDFAEVGYVDQQAEPLHGVTLIYTDPETLWWRKCQTQSSDTWSLACIIFELRASETLVAPGDGSMGEICYAVRTCVGDLPASWKQKLEQRSGVHEVQIVEDLPPHPQAADLGADDNDWSSLDKQLDELFEAQKPPPPGLKQRAKSAVMRFKHAVVSLLPSRPAPIHYWVEEGLEQQPQSLENTIRHIGTWTRWCQLSMDERMKALADLHRQLNTRNVKITREECDTGEPPHQALSEQEVQDFLSLLKMMLTWERKDRASLGEVLKQPWFTTDYDSVDKNRPWVEKYHRGYQYWSNGYPIF